MLIRVNYHIALNQGAPKEAELVLVTMRSPYKGMLDGWRWVPALAPSKDLFFESQGWVKSGTLPEKWDEYVTRYATGLNGLSIRPEDRGVGVKEQSPSEALANLMKLSDSMVIAVVCSCPITKAWSSPSGFGTKPWPYCHNQILVDLVNG